MIRRTSANILIVGGAAIFAAIINIHHIAIGGQINNIPLLIRSLRDSVCS